MMYGFGFYSDDVMAGYRIQNISSFMAENPLAGLAAWGPGWGSSGSGEVPNDNNTGESTEKVEDESTETLTSDSSGNPNYNMKNKPGTV